MNEFQKRIGVGETHYGLGRTKPTRQRIVVAEEGLRKGQTGVVYTDHSDGRMDAKVITAPVKAFGKN